MAAFVAGDFLKAHPGIDSPALRAELARRIETALRAAVEEREECGRLCDARGALWASMEGKAGIPEQARRDALARSNEATYLADAFPSAVTLLHPATRRFDLLLGPLRLAPSQPASTRAASFASDMRQPASLSAADRSSGQPVVHPEDVGAAVHIGDRHLALHRGVGRLEFDHLDDPLVRHELHEPPVESVRVRGRLARPSRRVVDERDAEGATPRASNACTWLVMPVGTIHFATACASRSAR